MTLDEMKQKCHEYRFTRGRGLGGPEFAGCCNTGMRPAILRCPYKEIREPLFFVGPEIAIDRHQMRIGLDRLQGKRKTRYGDDPRQTVYVFKTKRAAVAKFLKLCAAILEYNRQEREEVTKQRKRAQAGDLRAVLALGLDH